jgi:uncharacterized protein DUF6896
MDAHVGALLDAFARVKEPEPDDLVSALRRLPEPGVLPSPWDAWTLIGLVRHRERQLWVAELIRTRLQGAPADLAARGALGGHPEAVPQSGSVPGMPEWEYFFHGRGCCIRHKVDGDTIDVDFWDDSADYFDTFFYTHYLESLRHPEPPEERVRELHSSDSTVRVAIADLLAAGALAALPGGDAHPYRLADDVMTVADDVNHFCSVWLQPRRRVWLAGLVGDWLAADQAAFGRTELTGITAPRAAQCREQRRRRLRKEAFSEGLAAGALQGLADLHSPDLDECLETALSGPPSGLISTALEIIGRQDDRRWCARMYELFSRVDPAGRLPSPHIWITSLKFLLRHGYRSDEMIASLSKAGGTEIGEAVLLSLERAPELALPLIRKGLLADVPMCRTQVAAILALITTPWSRGELLRALNESDDQQKTADVRAALLESRDQEDHRAVRAWEERNPQKQETGSYLDIGARKLGPFYTFGELFLRNRGVWLRHEMEQLHDRVLQLKNVIPPEPPEPRKWWRFWR